MNRKFQLLKLLEEDPEDSFLLFAIGKELESEGEYHRAIEYLESLRKLNPAYSGLYYHLSGLYKKTGDLSNCKKILQLGIDECSRLNKLHDLMELKNAQSNLEIELLEDY